MQALAAEYFDYEEYEQYLMDSIDICAVWTVADCMVLTWENRVIVELGLAQIKNSRSRWIRTLLQDHLDVDLDADVFGFVIWPRLNAAGRMDSPYKAVNLILNQTDSVEQTIRDIEALNVTPFDNWVSERSLYKYWDEVREILEKNNALYEKDGKVWLKSSEYKDEKDRVVVREDGRPTYLAGDIIYHWDKFKRGYDRYINIWGADHHGYIARVKAAIKFLGFDPDRLEILLSQMVKLLKGGEPYKMSKRAGNFILVRDVVEDVGADALRFYLFES